MTKWVEFTQTVIFETEGRNKGPTFEAGSRHLLEDDFADRWLRRQVAFVVDGPATPPGAEQPPVAPIETSEASSLSSKRRPSA